MLRLFLFFALHLTAASVADDLPAIAPPNFSQVVGHYRISSQATPLAVKVDEPITLTVVIKGDGLANREPERKNLHIFPDDVAGSFHIEAVADQDKMAPREGRWEFVYRLRPKSAKVKVIPELQLVFLPTPAGQFQSSFADEIPISVTPRSEATPETLALKVVQAPARFYQLRPLAAVMADDRAPSPPGPLVLGLFFALPPLFCYSGYRLWRRLNPSAAQREHWRRSRAARMAIAHLEKQSAGTLTTRVIAVHFLRQRFDLAPQEPTPAEVAKCLRRRGVGKALVHDWQAFLATFDRCQFGPASPPMTAPAHLEAVRLIKAVEADACAA